MTTTAAPVILQLQSKGRWRTPAEMRRIAVRSLEPDPGNAGVGMRENTVFLCIVTLTAHDAHFLCGKDSLEHLNIEKNSFMSICSVYHHIIDKEVFLRQIKLENIDYILFELAVQPECYSGKSWRDELAYIMESLQFSANMLLGYSKDYHRPLVLISRNKLESKTAKKIKIECEKYLSNGDIG